jgi:hypothetical protein
MKRRRIFFFMLIAAGLGGFAWLVLKPREPVYRGRPLSSWLKDFEGWNFDTNLPACAAFREMGTNALPALLNILQSAPKPSRWQRVFDTLNNKQSFIKFPDGDPWAQTDAAAFALYSMGPAAKPALPVLTNLLVQTNRPILSALAVAGVGPEGVPPLLAALTNQSVIVRYSAAWSLGWEHSGPEIVVPALIQGLSDKAQAVRVTAARSLGQIHAQPELAVPALMQSFPGNDPILRRSIASALGQFGGHAKAAVPMLLQSLNDTNIQDAVKKALQEIDPAAAAKAGVK